MPFKSLLCLFCLAVASSVLHAQRIDSLQLKGNEIPAGYSAVNKLQCVTPHALSFYDQADLYQALIGKVVKKSFQSFSKKGDKGSILYLEFEDDFKAQAFLNGLLWGSESKPTKTEPDDYYARNNILVIWSFKLDSELKASSMEKVKRILN